ncbi:MAG: hypothetical protein JRG91_21315 [Deltaproteobacteria bacterium]|nr:hypothetical protein [Deltaproteobacteria bacterium]
MTADTALAEREQNTKIKREVYGDLPTLEGAMHALASQANLIAPIVALDHIPVFHEVSLRVVSIDPASETFEVQGGRALSKTALAKLSQAARISWDSQKSGRIDDGSDSLYCHFRAVGYWPDFSGTHVLEISGEKQLDLRTGSPMVARLGGEDKKQVLEMRAFILEHAESKARNRAIRQALALKSKYTEDELGRPFVVPTLIETGRCDDPELKRLYFEKKLEGKGIATRALYGGEPMLRSGDMEILEGKAEVIPQKQAPPPVAPAPVAPAPAGEPTPDPFRSDFEQR